MIIFLLTAIFFLLGFIAVMLDDYLCEILNRLNTIRSMGNK